MTQRAISVLEMKPLMKVRSHYSNSLNSRSYRKRRLVDDIKMLFIMTRELMNVNTLEIVKTLQIKS
jgi:hypothetical protein